MKAYEFINSLHLFAKYSDLMLDFVIIFPNAVHYLFDKQYLHRCF